jgi:hypothetical protein
MGHPQGQDIDADQLKALKPQLADTKKTAAPDPKQMPTSSVDTLREFVADTTSVIAPLRGDVDHQFATAERIVRSAAGYLAGKMPAVTAALKSDPGDVTQVTDLLQKLEAQLQILFVVARRHKVSLQGAHLDAVFDGQDAMRDAAGLGMLHRADQYYDDGSLPNAKPATQTPDPTSETLNSGKETTEEPKTRAELIKHIETFGAMVAIAMHSGMSQAIGILNEPDKEKPPEFLEVLADAILDFAINAATGMAGTLIKDMMKSAPKIHVGKEGGKSEEGEAEEKDVGHAMIDALADSVKDAGKGAVKPAIAAAGAPKEEDGGKEGKEGKEGKAPDKKLSLKTLYEQEAEKKTTAKMNATISNYSSAAAGKMLRMPVPTLKALYDSFTDDLLARISDEMAHQIVDGWVVFGKKSGQYAGDAKKRPSSSVLEAPYGICEIRLTADKDGENLSFYAATLPYQTDAVLANIQQQPGSLADLPIERSIRVGGLAFRPFTVDESGKIDDSVLKSMSVDELMAYANFAHAGMGGSLETAALAGMYKVLKALHSIPRSRITEGMP